MPNIYFVPCRYVSSSFQPKRAFLYALGVLSKTFKPTFRGDVARDVFNKPGIKHSNTYEDK